MRPAISKDKTPTLDFFVVVVVGDCCFLGVVDGVMLVDMAVFTLISHVSRTILGRQGGRN